ncbi:MAG: DUF1460 domain-containing protein [Bacteroidales bacterium]|nr:DUF1460 domain-containing protein [Bacteroidales bacterium]
MKTQLLVLLVLSFLFSCNSTPTSQGPDPELIVYQLKDKEILEQLIELYSAENEEETSALMVKVGSFFQETPYVAHTLETEEEQLVINLREMDCTTFAENCLAISRTIQSKSQTFEQFTSELQFIRYRDGIIDAYPSRLHYFCDWIFNNVQKNLIGDMSEAIAQTPFPKQINFMSTHPDSYRQLKESAPLIDLIAAQEKEISARKMFFIPETEIAEAESKLMDGDIVGITTSIEGIAIQHVVILIRQEGRIHMMHASSKAEKVVVSELTLEEYLLNNKSASGIMLARPI